MYHKVSDRKSGSGVSSSLNFFVSSSSNICVDRANIDVFGKGSVKRIRLKPQFVCHLCGSRDRNLVMVVQMSRKRTNLQDVEAAFPYEGQSVFNRFLEKSTCRNANWPVCHRTSGYLLIVDSVPRYRCNLGGNTSLLSGKTNS